MKITDDSVIGIISQLKIREEDKDSIKNCSEYERNKIVDESSEGIWDSNSKNHEIVDEDPQDVQDSDSKRCSKSDEKVFPNQYLQVHMLAVQIILRLYKYVNLHNMNLFRITQAKLMTLHLEVIMKK